MTTRRKLLAGVAAAALITITGCATGGAQTGKKGPTLNASTAAVKGDITVWSWDVAAKALKRLAPVFEQRHPGVKVTVVDIGYDNAYDKITVGLKSGKGLPDVVTVEGNRMQTYIGNFPNGFFDLTSVAAPYKKDFDPAAWATASDDKGRTLALPWDSGPVGVFYRRDLFQQAGVDPNTIQTWDDLIQAGVKIKAKTGVKLMSDDLNEDGRLRVMLQQEGQGFFKNGQVAIASPQSVRAMQILKSMRDKGLIDNEKGWDGQVSAMKDGKVATEPNAVWWSGTMTDEMKELSGKVGVFPLPAVDAGGGRVSNNGGSVLAVPAQSKNQQTAWAFTQFMLADAGNQASMLKNEGLFPAFLPAHADPYFSRPQPYFGGQPIYKEFAGMVKDIPPVEYTKDGAKATDLVYSAVAGVLLRGKDPKATLDSAAEQLAAATGRQVAK